MNPTTCRYPPSTPLGERLITQVNVLSISERSNNLKQCQINYEGMTAFLTVLNDGSVLFTFDVLNKVTFFQMPRGSFELLPTILAPVSGPQGAIAIADVSREKPYHHVVGLSPQKVSSDIIESHQVTVILPSGFSVSQTGVIDLSDQCRILTFNYEVKERF